MNVGTRRLSERISTICPVQHEAPERDLHRTPPTCIRVPRGLCIVLLLIVAFSSRFSPTWWSGVSCQRLRLSESHVQLSQQWNDLVQELVSVHNNRSRSIFLSCLSMSFSRTQNRVLCNTLMVDHVLSTGAGVVGTPADGSTADSALDET